MIHRRTYREKKEVQLTPLQDDVKLTMIPYYAWCHRGAGEMAVWLPTELGAASPAKPFEKK